MVTPEYDGDLEYAPLWCGESCTLVNDIRPAAEVVRQIVNEAVEALSPNAASGNGIASRALLPLDGHPCSSSIAGG